MAGLFRYISIDQTHGMDFIQLSFNRPCFLMPNTHCNSRSTSLSDVITSKRSFNFECGVSLDQNRRRSRLVRKSLLSTEQKRLNHSLLEQMRLLLCKEAYERCLSLVTNVEKYRCEIALADSTSSRKKPSRKQVLMNGLPNLSKHMSLVKISNEITKIQSRNRRLRTLLAGNVS